MAVVNLGIEYAGPDQHGKYVGVLDPTAQTSTNAEVVLAGSQLDARPWDVLTFGFRCATQNVTFYVYASDDTAFAIEQEITATGMPVVTTAIDTILLSRQSHVVASEVADVLSYRYYRVKIKSTAAGVHGSAIVTITGYKNG